MSYLADVLVRVATHPAAGGSGMPRLGARSRQDAVLRALALRAVLRRG